MAKTKYKVGDKVIPVKKYEEDWAGSPMARSFYTVLTVEGVELPNPASVNPTWTTYALSDGFYWRASCLLKATKKNIRVARLIKNVHGTPTDI